MIRTIRLSLLILFLLPGLWGTGPLAESTPELNGRHVRDITRAFLSNHYSQAKFDDAHSQLVFAAYLRQFDRNHLYFVQADIDKFKEFEFMLDDLIGADDLDFPVLVFSRFKTRLEERSLQIDSLLASPFDLETDEKGLGDRSDASYPKDTDEARELWRKKLKFDLLALMTAGGKEEAGREILRKRYRNYAIRIRQYNHNDVVSAYLNAFTAAFDPHSAYLSPDDLENFNIALRLSLEGIGATLRSEDGYTIITSIIPGGAADREGTLKPEDKIVGVGQGEEGPYADVVNQRLSDVVKLIRGRRGTKVRLAFLRLSDSAIESRTEVTIVRDKIVLKEGEASGKIIEHPAGTNGKILKLGVITLPSFYVDFAARRSNPIHYKSSSQDVKRILNEFLEAKVDGVVLDLRSNGGGGLDEAVSLSGLFLERGPVVMVKDYRGRLSTMENPHRKPLYRGPLLVMTNRYSASASEILAGALKDYGRAILVGDRSTFGKGTVQNIISLQNGLGAVKTTVAKFYRPGSASTQHRGVVPDIVLPSVNNHMEIGESSLENALPWDAIPKADFEPWEDLSPYLLVIQENSRQRLAKSEEFQEVSVAVQKYVDNMDKRSQMTAREIMAEIRRRLSESENEEDDSAGNKPSADIYLDESLSILADHIRLHEQGATQHDVANQM
ncbi:MAG: carboxy terminal-processing peptidase [SAR324 cluster bacterium]|nr:carboxy terminal-processing peptidase [SAR324 cluster bacterium]